MKYWFFFIAASWALLVGCKQEKPLQVSLEVNEVMRDSHEIEQAPIAVMNSTLADTFFLVKRDFTEGNKQYYEYHFRTFERKLYSDLVPAIRDIEFSLVNNPYSVSWADGNQKVDIKDFPTLWTELIYFGNEFYLKYRSDFCSLNQKVVTDSCLIEITCEGPVPKELDDVT